MCKRKGIWTLLSFQIVIHFFPIFCIPFIYYRPTSTELCSKHTSKSKCPSFRYSNNSIEITTAHHGQQEGVRNQYFPNIRGCRWAGCSRWLRTGVRVWCRSLLCVEGGAQEIDRKLISARIGCSGFCLDGWMLDFWLNRRTFDVEVKSNKRNWENVVRPTLSFTPKRINRNVYSASAELNTFLYSRSLGDEIFCKEAYSLQQTLKWA